MVYHYLLFIDQEMFFLILTAFIYLSPPYKKSSNLFPILKFLVLFTFLAHTSNDGDCVKLLIIFIYLPSGGLHLGMFTLDLVGNYHSL